MKVICSYTSTKNMVEVKKIKNFKKDGEDYIEFSPEIRIMHEIQVFGYSYAPTYNYIPKKFVKDNVADLPAALNYK